MTAFKSHKLLSHILYTKNKMSYKYLSKNMSNDAMSIVFDKLIGNKAYNKNNRSNTYLDPIFFYNIGDIKCLNCKCKRGVVCEVCNELICSICNCPYELYVMECHIECEY